VKKLKDVKNYQVPFTAGGAELRVEIMVYIAIGVERHGASSPNPRSFFIKKH
jgi:hypothetical protein